MYSVGQVYEYGVRAIQTYTDLDSKNRSVYSNQPTNMTIVTFRVPFFSQAGGSVLTEAGTGVEGVKVSYCHLDRSTGQPDTNPLYCPVATFTTDRLGQYSGIIQVANVNWISLSESFYVIPFYNQSLQNNKFIVHSFMPARQKVTLTHLGSSATSTISITDTTAISIFGSIEFDPTIMGNGFYYSCPFNNVPIVLVQGNGESVYTKRQVLTYVNILAI